jgi:hypothetical protein
MKFTLSGFLLLTLFSCTNSEEEAVTKNNIETESQLQKMNVMLYERGEDFSSNIKSEWSTTPKNIENQVMRSHLSKIIRQINDIDTLTLHTIYFLDQLKASLLEGDRPGQGIELKPSIVPNIFDFTVIETPLNTDITRDFFINSDNIPSKTGIELFNRFKSYRNDLVKVVGSIENHKMFVKDINDYKNEKDLEEKVISQISSKVPNPMDDQQAIKDLYINLTLPNYVSDGNKKTPWVSATFQHSNLIGAISQLTILQNKILQARAYALAHISSRMNSCGYGFDRIIPFAQGPSIIHEGETADITVGIAAFDSYNQPEVTLQSINGEILKPENGTGKVRVKPKKGLQKIQGTVSIKNKSGVKKTERWEWDVQVLPKK